MTTKTAALATRGIKSFQLFQSKEFVSGYQNLVTIQPLNKSKTRGWFVRKSDLDTCGWSATEDQFAKASVIWNYKQTFGMAPNTSIDKAASDLSNSKGEMYKRKFSVRTKYLVYILTKDNVRAHKIPMVLTLKGLNGTDTAEKIKLYEKEMSKCLSKALSVEVPLAFNEKFYATTVFTPVLVNDMRGANNVEICAIESFDLPDYSTEETAIESLNRMSIPDEDRESTWKFQALFADYINVHAKQDAEKLNGAYGIRTGVEILPEARGTSVVEVKVLPDYKNITGEDETL